MLASGTPGERSGPEHLHSYNYSPTPEGAVAKARYYGLASGGANQLPVAAARAFTPLPPTAPTSNAPGPHPR
ncbi:hypothetical protein K1T71_013091 [Dendrolimus kikuchii]|uniref:Uncharacterized protein n=1 Tax=Dendrolimus kikuchii TaxID=765133 RepID=A0ACC1CIZ3_9NEOP|nr:hypothetical protein K1T71_013091 [Dendrolimus kikuchii]